jgi:hypothetical protein
MQVQTNRNIAHEALPNRSLEANNRNFFWQKVHDIMLREFLLPSLNLSKTELDGYKQHFYQKLVPHVFDEPLREIADSHDFWTTLEKLCNPQQFLSYAVAINAAIISPDSPQLPASLKKELSALAVTTQNTWSKVQQFYTGLKDGEKLLKSILFKCLKEVTYPNYDQSLKTFIETNYVEFLLPASRSNQLSCIVIKNPVQRDIPEKEQKWIVYFCPSTMCYEQKLGELQVLSQKTGRNLIVYNYRGTGHSEKSDKESQGDLIVPQDFEQDGNVVVQHLINNCKAQPKNIIAFGADFGGSVALNVSKGYQGQDQEMTVVVDKTFTTLDALVIELFRDKFKGIGNIILRIIRFVLEKLEWNFDSWSAYQKISGPKFIIEHPKDGLITGQAKLGNKALEHWQKMQDPNVKKPVVIEDDGQEEMTQGNLLMTPEGYGSHVVSCLRKDQTGTHLSVAYQRLIAHL